MPESIPLPPHTVPAVDGAANLSIRDVIGNRSDSHDTNTLAGRLHMMYDHTHKAMDVYPTAASGVVLTAGDAAPWTLGSFAVIAPALAIDMPFDLHFIVIEAMSANATYELVLYSGVDASEVEIAHVRFVRVTNQVRSAHLPIQTPVNVADGQIKAKVMSSTGNLDTVTVSLAYHEY